MSGRKIMLGVYYWALFVAISLGWGMLASASVHLEWIWPWEWNEVARAMAVVWNLLIAPYVAAAFVAFGK